MSANALPQQYGPVMLHSCCKFWIAPLRTRKRLSFLPYNFGCASLSWQMAIFLQKMVQPTKALSAPKLALRPVMPDR
eukprot:COSAG06_NODE_6963_length_2695_cov_1.823960_5_plen_76_part_01